MAFLPSITKELRPGPVKDWSPALAAILLLVLCLVQAAAAATTPAPSSARSTLARVIFSPDISEQATLLRGLIGSTDPGVEAVLTAWRGGSLFVHDNPDGSQTAFLLDPTTDGDGHAQGLSILDDQPIPGPDAKPLLFSPSELTPADTTAKLRKAIKNTLDFMALGNPDPRFRKDAVVKLGQERNLEYLPLFEARAREEKDPEVSRRLAEALALTRTASPDPAVRVPALRTLGELRSVTSLSFLQSFEKKLRDGPTPPNDESLLAVHKTVLDIETYQQRGNLIGTAFRGFSLAAVLLVAALGLAITFGLMGIINMAHGELMMVGAYTTYVVQNLVRSAFGPSGLPLETYFLVALASSFVVTAAVGLILEQGIIRFLYRRPLESMLATWGVSLLLQQVFRHVFGAANVQVGSPSWLSGSLVIQDVLFAYNRIFVIFFAALIVLGTWSLLTRTSVGLQIRAVMQNRAMASTLGVRTDRVNMLTFAYGSGLAGMAGACLSQIGNVGPGLGQNYIIDCFMIVVLGGIGNIFGTVTASLGVGVTDQILQPWLGAVMGKITVLATIILFLQWRPAGLFVTRSRSLEG